MKTFQMCEECEREYNDPSSRRFHAQPNACHKCGPSVSLLNSKGEVISREEDAIDRTASLVKEGNIIAIKGIGGYHLVCDAMNDTVVIELRKRKHREEKPMAVMFPDTMMIKMHARVSDLEERALTSIERPIVILDKKEGSNISPHVSSTETIGAFLPYSPLHHILLKKLNSPIIATSANITEEPIAKDEDDAMQRLSGIADYFLIHNRPIVRRCDDSVVRIMAERQIPIRRSRGYVPVPIIIPFVFKRPVLALGAHMHTTIALGIDNRVYVSQHIGDLETPLNIEFYKETIDDFLRLFDVKPHIVVTDLHPEYYSTRYGSERFRERTLSVQHHHAHIISCMAENEIPEGREVIGFAFDGTGYGTDGSIWGSEVIIASYNDMRLACHLRPYRLPGGDRATEEPWRVGISLLYKAFGEDTGWVDLEGVDKIKKDFILQMIKKGINSPYTTSMGRLFDGVASIIGLRQRVSYQAQSAIELEDLAKRAETLETYEFQLEGPYIDHRQVIRGIVSDLRSGTDKGLIARKFHNTIVQMIVSVAEKLRDETGIEYVALSGGVFQNSIILEHSYNRLRELGFIPLVHQLVPPNDGGLSLGQAVYGLFSST